MALTDPIAGAGSPLLAQAIALRDAAFREMALTPEYLRWAAASDAVSRIEQTFKSDPRISPLEGAKLQLGGGLSGLVALGGKKTSQADGAVALIRAAGVPLSIADIVRDLSKVGAVVGGENPEINVSSSLSRDQRLISVRYDGRALWWLKDAPLPHQATPQLGSIFGLAGSAAIDPKGGDEHGPPTT